MTKFHSSTTVFSCLALTSVTPAAVYKARDLGKDQGDLFVKDTKFLPENMAIVWSGCKRTKVSLEHNCVLEYSRAISNSCSCS